MTFHKITIVVDADADAYEWRQRIIDAVPANNYVNVEGSSEVIVIDTPELMKTVDALKNDGFTI